MCPKEKEERGRGRRGGRRRRQRRREEGGGVTQCRTRNWNQTSEVRPLRPKGTERGRENIPENQVSLSLSSLTPPKIWNIFIIEIRASNICDYVAAHFESVGQTWELSLELQLAGSLRQSQERNSEWWEGWHPGLCRSKPRQERSLGYRLYPDAVPQQHPHFLHVSPLCSTFFNLDRL